jgi:hypothetical protein
MFLPAHSQSPPSSNTANYIVNLVKDSGVLTTFIARKCIENERDGC